MSTTTRWPVLTRYPEDRLGAIRMPLGGIGTGTVSLGGRGDLVDWEVMNKPHKQTPSNCFAALWAKPRRGRAVTRCLEGALQPPFTGATGATAPNHGLPRFRHCRFLAAYPFGQVELSDPGMPLSVRLEAFNPLVPGDADASGLPIAVLRYVLRNDGREPVEAAVCWSLENFIGWEHNVARPSKGVNRWRDGAAARGVFLRSEGVAAQAPQWGTLALATSAPPEDLSHRLEWKDPRWAGALLDFWEDFSADGRLEPRTSGIDAPVCSLAARVLVPPRAERSLTFILAWHFPNRMSWSLPRSPEHPHGGGERPMVGNYYCTQFADAWAAVDAVAPRLAELEARTRTFVHAFVGSDLPHAAKEAALCNLSTLRTQTVFRTPDGRMFAWEGAFDFEGSCWGSCTHVWNYELTTPFLFAGLARTMRDVEFAHCTDPASGHMCFRADLPLERARGWIIAAADGQLGCLMKLHREWQLSGDEGMLRRLWPNARKALEFCWIPRGWDADRDGVMEGCQHNTMDVEYFGPNPEIQFWYLGALRAAEAMARHLGEESFAATCADLFARGRRWTDRHLFNGAYYEQQVRPIPHAEDIAPGLRTDMGSRDLAEPDFQIGPGCLSDQLLGQLHAHVAGLGSLCDPERERAALASVMRHNFRDNLSAHFNPMRSYALNDEAGLLVATFPRGGRPRQPFPYCDEVWTGMEYTAALGMIYAGLRRDGLRVIAAARARHDGAKRNPFDEPECGHHYARAMAAWGAVLALTGFHWSAVTGTLAFRAAPPAQWFWSNGSAWGTVEQRRARGAIAFNLALLHGELTLRTIALDGAGTLELSEARRLAAGDVAEFLVPVRASARRPARGRAARRR